MPGQRVIPWAEVGDRARRLARTGHPETSKAGARDAEKRLGRLRQAALDAVVAYPGSTASELEAALGTLGRTIGRRLCELERLWRITRTTPRHCRVTGRMAATWTAR